MHKLQHYFGSTDYPNENYLQRKTRYAIRLKFEDKFLTSLTKLVLQVKASICSTVKENLLLYVASFRLCCRCHNFTYFMIRSVSQRNTAFNRNN